MTEEVTEELNLGYILIKFLYKTQDTFFYAFIIQLILVSYAYFKIGHGKFWTTLFVASIAGFVAAVLEKICMACTEHPDNKNMGIYILLLIDEPGWILSEFCIPYLNMVKLEAFISKVQARYLKVFVGIAFVLFAYFRFKIGYLRYSCHTVFNDDIYHAHGYAFSIMAITELICTFFILKKMTKDYKLAKKRGIDGNIYEYSRKSSFFILLIIDFCGFILAILSMFSNYTLEGILKPFHCIKSNFVLILAVDTLIFKLTARRTDASGYYNTSSANKSYASNNTNTFSVAATASTAPPPNKLKPINEISNDIREPCIINMSAQGNCNPNLRRPSYENITTPVRSHANSKSNIFAYNYGNNNDNGDNSMTYNNSANTNNNNSANTSYNNNNMIYNNSANASYNNISYNANFSRIINNDNLNINNTNKFAR